ncbi:MAG: hypothetical protein NW700_20840, partial [Nitrospiraceae bacterium]
FGLFVFFFLFKPFSYFLVARGGWMAFFSPGRDSGRPRLLHAQKEMAATVLLITRFIVLRTERPVLTERDDGDLFGVHTQIAQNPFDSLRSLLSEHDVVIVGAPLIAMTGYADLGARVSFDPLGIRRQSRHRFIGDAPEIEAEEGISQTCFNGSFFFPTKLGHSPIRLFSGRRQHAG